MADYHVSISAKHKWLSLNLKEVWNYRDLIYLFTKRNFVVSYKQTILGPAWLFLTPLLSSVVQAFVFGGIAGIGTEGVPTYLFYLCSNAIWAYFANCLSNNANTFTDNAYVFGKVYFPRLVTPISNVISTIFMALDSSVTSAYRMRKSRLWGVGNFGAPPKPPHLWSNRCAS